MLDTVPPHLLTPLSADSVRWHLPADEYGNPDAIEVTCAVTAASLQAAWTTLKARPAENRHADPALHRLLLNIHILGLDATPDGCLLSLYVSSRGIHDLLHAHTGARFAEALSAESRIQVAIADCDSRLRWTRNIYCHRAEPKLPVVEPDWAAIHAWQDAVIDGRVVQDHAQAASERLLLALERRAGIGHSRATWAQHPEGMFTVWFSPGDARRLVAMGIPAAPQLAERGPDVGFTLTNEDCRAFTAAINTAAG
ncbi:hypothetical protein [Streptomyces sp. t99]|uniref:hypothetical protein n=1 Tax=Streptomyces sp. t99 TaxID=1828172 RepID=UPI000BFE6477|nr:hypothetical protein [Streptomyces sp. t99]